MKNDEEIISEATERLKLCEEWESYFRSNFRFDKKMDAADSVNGFAWPEGMIGTRTDAWKPSLTINKAHQFVLQVANECAANPPETKISPVGNGATFKSAEILEGLVRSIWNTSNGNDALNTATYNAIVGGYGVVRVITEYADDGTFDQVIKLKRVENPLDCFIDPNIKEFDGSDANYGFVCSSMPKSQFDHEYPKFADEVSLSSAPLGTMSQDEDYRSDVDPKNVRVLEYFRRVEKHDRLHLLPDGSTVLESVAKQAGFHNELKATTLRSRPVLGYEVEWFLIASDQIISRTTFPSQYIPLVRVIGEENVIEGQLDRHGLIRAMIDSQRMYCVAASQAVEYIGGQTMTPWLVSAQSYEGFETYWDRSNIKTKGVIVYNGMADDGTVLPPPTRIDPPIYADAYEKALMQADGDMMASCGIYQAQLGEQSNERSGKAINARTKNGNNATAHFPRNAAVACTYIGKIILDLVPAIYDTARTLKILGVSGDQQTIAIDPEMPEAHKEVDGSDYDQFTPQAVSHALNPSVGKYDCIAQVGDSWGTKREEAWNAISQILMQNESLTPIIGGLLFKAADFPLANEISDRLEEIYNAKASPELQAAQQQLAVMHGQMIEQQQQIEKLKTNALIKEQQKDIDIFDSETKRIDVVNKVDPDLAKLVVRGMSSNGLGADVTPLIHEQALAHAVTQSVIGQMAPQQEGQQ